MIDLSGIVSMAFLKKSVFTGGYQGMRYLLRKQESEEHKTVLEAIVWPEPFNFEHTAEEKKHGEMFLFDGEGLKDAVAWLNQQYRENRY